MKKETNTDNPYHLHFDNYMDTNACTECTGLMHRPADSREEWEVYHEVFDFSPKGRPKDAEAPTE